jgi:hypothetical protein
MLLVLLQCVQRIWTKMPFLYNRFVTCNSFSEEPNLRGKAPGACDLRPLLRLLQRSLWGVSGFAPALHSEAIPGMRAVQSIRALLLIKIAIRDGHESDFHYASASQGCSSEAKA